MALWVLAHPPWQTLARVRLRWDFLVKSGTWTSKQFLSTPTLTTETPAMREVKAYPYPATAPDASLFEEATDEYQQAGGETEAHTGTFVVDPPSTMLKNLVKEGRYADAARVRAELADIGVEIPLHPVYHFAARQSLKNPSLSRRERLETFITWWSLFPPRPKVEDYKRSIGSVLATLLRDDTAPDIPLIVRYAVLAASKGYACVLGQEVIPVVARYAPDEVFMSFFKDFCDAAQHFEKSLAESGDVVHCISPDLSSWYRLAVKELLNVRNKYVAVKLLRMARARRIHIDDIKALFQHLSRDPPFSLASPSRSLLRPPLTPRPRVPKKLPATVDTATEDRGLSTSGADELKAMVIIARSLKHSLAAEKLPWNGKALSKVLAVFTQKGRWSLIHRLRVRAYRHQQLIPTWALAEMMLANSLEYSLFTIMKEFESHFHLVGVPRGFADELWEEHVARGARGPTRPRPPILRKFPPTYEQTHLIWHLFLARASTRAQVRRLYLQFLEDVAASRRVPASAIPHIASLPSWKPTTDPEEYARPIPPPILFRGGHFALFMEAFERHGAPTLAARVVLDMYALQARYYDDVFDQFVSALRYMPSEFSATAYVNYFETAIDGIGVPRRPRKLSELESDSSGGRLKEDPLKTEIRVFVYAGIMRRLLLDGRGGEAARVAKRYMLNVPHHPGANAVMDALLREPVIARALGA